MPIHKTDSLLVLLVVLGVSRNPAGVLMKTMTTSLILTVAFSSACASTPQSQILHQAKIMFSRYQSLERSFDPASGDLFCDDALIRHAYADHKGQKRTLEIPVAELRKLMPTVMPVSESEGDLVSYSDVVYVPDRGNVRITATAHPVLEKYMGITRPISLLVGVCDNGEWGILEQLR